MEKLSLSIDEFIEIVSARGAELYRDFTWRNINDPYKVLISEIMLQQTQTARVEKYFERWLEKFPTIDALAAGSTQDVLELWQGLGYNRRALALKALANQIADERGGVLPIERDELLALPGVGPATAAGVRAFAYNQPADYLETNVRTVFLHEFWPEEEGIRDKEIYEVMAEVSKRVAEHSIDARTWNYALLDYGAWLKKNFSNPSRRSKHHTRQSAYEGSRRQKRAALLKEVLRMPRVTVGELCDTCGYESDVALDVLDSLCAEGFLALDEKGRYSVSD